MSQGYNLSGLGQILNVDTVGNNVIHTANAMMISNGTSCTVINSTSITLLTATYVGNATVNTTINSTSFTGTSNNTLFIGTVAAANVVSNAQLSANLTAYQTTAGLSAKIGRAHV